jgi:hypothetical protein
MKAKNLLLLLVIAAGVVVSILYCAVRNAESIWYFLFAGETVYSADYREDAFCEVSQGWSEMDVHRTLGEPIAIETLAFENSWTYCSISPKTDSHELTYSLGPSTRIKFDPNGVAVQVTGDLLTDVSAGMTQESIEAKWGQANSILVQHAGYRYRYSRPGPSGTYKVRAVILDENKTVTGKESYIYFD